MLDKVNSVLDRVWPQWTRWWWVAVLVIAGVTALGVREPWLLPLVVPLYVLIVLVWGRAIVRGFGRSLMSGGVSADRSSYDLVECVLVYGLRRVFRFGAARRETGRRAGHRGSMGPADVPMLVT